MIEQQVTEMLKRALGDKEFQLIVLSAQLNEANRQIAESKKVEEGRGET